MDKSSEMGSNRTGVAMSPLGTRAMIKDSEKFSPESRDGNPALAAIEAQYISSDASVGSTPVPATVKGALKSVVDKATGSNPEVFLNKLGERLAFERTGVRLYESFIRKCDALGDASAPVDMDQLRQMRDEEEEHFHLLKQSLEDLGADPTSQTPDADVAGVASSGIMKVLTDPRTSISHGLEALLMAELTDNAAWELLIMLSNSLGMDDMTEKFQWALEQEQVHLATVTAWHQEAVSSQLKKRTDKSRH